MELDKDGKRIGTGIDGCDGYLLWCAVNKPEQYMALLAAGLAQMIINNAARAGRVQFGIAGSAHRRTLSID